MSAADSKTIGALEQALRDAEAEKTLALFEARVLAEAYKADREYRPFQLAVLAVLDVWAPPRVPAVTP